MIPRLTFKVVETVLQPENVTKPIEYTVIPKMEPIFNNLHESGALAAQSDALLPKLVSGEVQVSIREGV